MGAMPPNFGDFQVMVAGSPDLRRWTVRCHGPLSYPGYACDAGYGLDRVGRTNEDYTDATTHVAGGSGRDIHFKMYKMANVDRAHNGPLDWMGLLEALFGGLLLPEGVPITLPRGAARQARVDGGCLFRHQLPRLLVQAGPVGGGSQAGWEVPVGLGRDCYCRMAG